MIATANQLSPSAIEAIEARIAPLRARLAAHPLYRSIANEAHLRTFMQAHVFAVWDFMSLLKALQTRLTCTTSPWRPTPLPASRRFINEIVLGEESDLFEGQAISHFELYLKAMHEAGADTAEIAKLLARLHRMPVLDAVDRLPAGPRAFTRSTFRLIESDRLHAMAASFTFGREDVIPEMFRALVHDLNRQNAGALSTFVWYLERHIEVDGEDHGPLALRMVADICGTDGTLWEEAGAAAEDALRARIALWDAILAEIS